MAFFRSFVRLGPRWTGGQLSFAAKRVDFISARNLYDDEDDERGRDGGRLTARLLLAS